MCPSKFNKSEVIAKLEKAVTSRSRVHKNLKRLDSRFRSNNALGVLQLTLVFNNNLNIAEGKSSSGQGLGLDLTKLSPNIVRITYPLWKDDLD